MPSFSIHIVNRDFESSNSIDALSLDAARMEALKGALQIGSEEVWKGSAFFGAEIRIQGEDEAVERLVVAIGTSRLR